MPDAVTWVLVRHDVHGAHLTPEGTEAPLIARGFVVEPLPEGVDAHDPYAPSGLAEALAIADAKRQADARKQATKKAATSATDKKE